MQRVRIKVTDGFLGQPGRYDVGDEGVIVETLDGTWKGYTAVVMLDRYQDTRDMRSQLMFAPDEFEAIGDDGDITGWGDV
jgi:hypothetical protein